MRRNKTLLFGLCCIAPALLAQPAQSRVMLEVDPFMEPQMGGFASAGPFTMVDPPLGKPGLPAASEGSHGSTIVAWKGGTLSLDADSGKLVQLDRSGSVVARRTIAKDATQMVVDAKARRLYAVDRLGDRIVVVDLAQSDLPILHNMATRAEPFGVALSPDTNALLVTTVADHSLSAYDTGSLAERWNLELGPEPRGVAVSADGSTALVGFLSAGAVAKIDLSKRRPKLSYVALDPPRQSNPQQFFRPAQHQSAMASSNKAVQAKRTAIEVDPETIGRRYARNAFAVGFIGHGLAVVPHQVSMPHAPTNGFENAGSYGGGFLPPIAHRLSFIDAEHSGKVAGAEIDLHQPRALAYAADTDTLFVVGYGSDTISAFASVSQPSVHLAWQSALSTPATCGPTGVAVDRDGAKVSVFCSLSRRVGTIKTKDRSTTWSDPLTKTSLTVEAQAGRELFRRGRDARMSQAGALACASCHPEGRTDGLSWRIEGNTLQTPLLAGRLVGAHPFKWDGKDADLQTSLRNTVKRLGGSGVTNEQSKQLQAFLTSLPSVRTPTPASQKAVARGRALFYSADTGCADCHTGKNYSDGAQHDLAPELGDVDTPSLKGLAVSAPYYHDGSARTLRALLMENGSVHGMGGTAQLESKQLDDLVAFLETL
jgi:DNA-binding beta-propeller fold protein YncE/mono/diheme cytochrome c family protein